MLQVVQTVQSLRTSESILCLAAKACSIRRSHNWVRCLQRSRPAITKRPLYYRQQWRRRSVCQCHCQAPRVVHYSKVQMPQSFWNATITSALTTRCLKRIGLCNSPDTVFSLLQRLFGPWMSGRLATTLLWRRSFFQNTRTTTPASCCIQSLFWRSIRTLPVQRRTTL